MEHLGSAPFVEPGQVLLGEEEDQDRRSGQHEERQHDRELQGGSDRCAGDQSGQAPHQLANPKGSGVIVAVQPQQTIADVVVEADGARQGVAPALGQGRHERPQAAQRRLATHRCAPAG